MSISTYIQGFKPPDEEWEAMKAIYDVCKKGKVDPPEKVLKFFEYEPPDEAGVKVNLGKIAKEYHDDVCSGLEIEVAKLPEGVKIIRFVNSW